MGTAVHKIKQQLTAEQVHWEVLNFPIKHSGKDYCHDRHDQQRIENTPDIAQDASAIFQLNIFHYEESNQIPVAPKLFD
jgi:hypothetical protein